MCAMHSQRARRQRAIPCSIDSCEAGEYAKGLCSAHYLREIRGIDSSAPVKIYKATSHASRAWEMLQRSIPDKHPAECWIWPASGWRGYGRIKHEGVTRPVHRVLYEDVINEIPEGLQIDHLCENPPCVNPWHLEPVSLEENIRRRDERRPSERAGIDL